MSKSPHPGIPRATSRRLFLSVSGVELDSAGNARRADVHYVDKPWRGGHPVWRPLSVGQGLYSYPFRMRLLDTPRAGLHVATQVKVGGELRYGTNAKLVEEGIFVFNPSDLSGLAERIDHAIADPVEAAAIERVLGDMYGFGSDRLAGGARNLRRLDLIDPRKEEEVRFVETYGGTYAT